MKKKFFSFFLTLCLSLTFAVVPAYAFSEYATASITTSGTTMIFKGTVRTNASNAYVAHIQTHMYAYNSMSGKVYRDATGIDSNVNYLTLAHPLTNFDKTWYVNEVGGCVRYYNESSNHYVNDTEELNLTNMKAASNSSETQTTISEYHHLVRDEILRSFNYDPENYEFYLNGDLSTVLPIDQYLNVRYQLCLDEGDTIPGYYLNADHDTIVAVNQNSNDDPQIFTFNVDSDGNWALV